MDDTSNHPKCIPSSVIHAGLCSLSGSVFGFISAGDLQLATCAFALITINIVIASAIISFEAPRRLELVSASDNP